MAFSNSPVSPLRMVFSHRPVGKWADVVREVSGRLCSQPWNAIPHACSFEQPLRAPDLEYFQKTHWMASITHLPHCCTLGGYLEADLRRQKVGFVTGGFLPTRPTPQLVTAHLASLGAAGVFLALPSISLYLFVFPTWLYSALP